MTKKFRLLAALALLLVVVVAIVAAGTQTASAQTTPTCTVSAQVRAGTINEFDIQIADASPNGWWRVQFGDFYHVDVDVVGGVASTYHSYDYTVGGTSTFIIQGTWPSYAGNVYCQTAVVIDDRPPLLPDLTIASEISDGWLNTTVRNDGTASAQGFYVRAYADEAEDDFANMGYFLPLPPGGSFNWSTQLEDGDYTEYVRVVVDPENSVVESNDENNSVTVYPASTPTCSMTVTKLPDGINHVRINLAGQPDGWWKLSRRMDGVLTFTEWTRIEVISGSASAEGWFPYQVGQPTLWEIRAEYPNTGGLVICETSFTIGSRISFPMASVGRAQATMSARLVSGINVYDVTLIPNRSGSWRLKVDEVNWVDVEVNSGLDPVTVRRAFTIVPGVSTTYVVTAHHPLEGPERGRVLVTVDNSPP